MMVLFLILMHYEVLAEMDLFLKAVVWKYLIKCAGGNIYHILGTQDTVLWRLIEKFCLF